MRMTVTTGVDRPGIVSRMGIMIVGTATKIPDHRGFGNPRVSRWYAPPDATPGALLGRGHHAVPRATAPRPPARGRADRRAPRPLRRGRGRAPAGLHQRPRASPLPDGVEPLRPVRSRAARPAPLPPPAPLRILGARRLPPARLPVPVGAARHARLPRPAHPLGRPAPPPRE